MNIRGGSAEDERKVGTFYRPRVGFSYVHLQHVERIIQLNRSSQVQINRNNSQIQAYNPICLYFLIHFGLNLVFSYHFAYFYRCEG